MEREKPIVMEGAVCPVPLAHNQTVVMGHGSGGKMSRDLVARFFLPRFDNPSLNAGDDAGVIAFESGERLAFSTDSHVVWPLFFPGGDIGRLAVCGTVNDIAMMGARPQFLSAGFILEEGLDLALLEAAVASMQSAAQEAGIWIVAGDTKVVQKGKADGLYINTAGVGSLPAGLVIGGAQARPGDVVILSGPIGDHGIAVLGARGELGFEADVQSDVAPLNHLVSAMVDAGVGVDGSQGVHVLRDPTRGGLATSLNEIARQSRVSVLIDESQIPVRPAVEAACEVLGFDPLYVANEGKLIVIVHPERANQVLEAMTQMRYGGEAVVIGEIQPTPQGRVLMRTQIGGTRVIDVLAGEMLPRIC